MTYEILSKAVKALEGTDYEGYISDLKFTEINDQGNDRKLYIAWCEDQSFTVTEKGVVLVADYLKGTATWYRCC